MEEGVDEGQLEVYCHLIGFLEQIKHNAALYLNMLIAQYTHYCYDKNHMRVDV